MLAASTLITALYLAVLAGPLLAVAAKIFFGAGLLFFAGAVVIMVLRQRKIPDVFTRLLTPGFVLFLVVILAAWFRMHGQVFLEWDDFSHWGLAIKDIVLNGALPASDSLVTFKDYPPGSTLFQYFMGVPVGYCEGNALFFHSLLLFSAAVAFTAGFSWRKALAASAAFMLPCLFISVFGFSFRTVMVDSLIGFFAGAALAGYFLSKDSLAAAALRVTPVLFVLPLFKPVGTLLAFAVAVAITADIVHQARVGGTATGIAGRSRFARFALLIPVLLLLAPAISTKSWSRHVKALHLAETFNTRIPASSVFDSFSGRATVRDKTTIAAFTVAMFKKNMGRPGLPPLVWALLLLWIATSLFYHSVPAERSQIKSSQTVMTVCFFAYSFGLLLLYLNSFGEYEGTRLASFGRYMGLFMLAWGASLAGFVARWLRGAEGRDIRPVHVAAIAALVLAVWAFIPLKNKHLAVRESVARIVAQAKIVLKSGDRVYLIWQNTDGYEYYISRYELFPFNSALAPFSVGRKYKAGDAWTQDLAVRDWVTMLSKNDYLLVGRADAAFWERYSRLFVGKPLACGSGLFRIRGAGGSVNLECSSKRSGV